MIDNSNQLVINSKQFKINGCHYQGLKEILKYLAHWILQVETETFQQEGQDCTIKQIQLRSQE
jgi:hypothetical protein